MSVALHQPITASIEDLVTLAHDAKNPLACLHAQAQILRKWVASEPAVSRERLDEVLGKIEANARRAGGLIDELLSAACYKASRDAPQSLVATDLVDLVQHVVAEFKAISRARQVRVNIAEP